MKRTILICAVGYILGIFWGLYYESNIAFLYLLIVLLIIGIKIIFKIQKGFKLISLKRYSRYLKLIINKKVLMLLLISSLISNSIVKTQNYEYENLYNSIEESDRITATVISNKIEKEYYDTYTIKVDNINEDKKFRNTNLLVQVNKKNKLNYGEKIQVSGEYMQGSEQRNFKGFSYFEYLKIKKCYGTIKISNIKSIGKENKNKVLTFINEISNKLKENVYTTMPEKYSAVLTAILLGDKSNVEEEIINNFQISNISHVIAISGMHISIIIVGLSYLLNKIGKRRLKILLISFLLFYMALTNFSTSVVRAVIMAIIMQMSELVHRKSDIWTNISFSALILLIYNPFYLEDISFQLTFMGTIGIILFQKNILKQLDKIKLKRGYRIRNYKIIKILDGIKEILSVTFSAQIMILPILICKIHYISTYFVISNFAISILIAPIISTGLIVLIFSCVSINIATAIRIYFYIAFETNFSNNRNNK